jgi:catechol 2,3-dioxygenase-like lactoylglutathione lyase family enzyme
MPKTQFGPEPVNFHPAVPILRVANLAASIAYYTRVLGFRIDWEHEGVMTSVSRGGANVMLCEGHQGCAGTWVWIGVGDAARLHEEYAAAGAKIPLPPRNYSWAIEFHVQDPDGHVLRFGSDPREDLPIADWVPWYATGAG